LHENAAKRPEAEDMDQDIAGKYLTILLLGQGKDAALEFAQALVFNNRQINLFLLWSDILMKKQRTLVVTPLSGGLPVALVRLKTGQSRQTHGQSVAESL
jgi:hypothetical protein